MANYSIALGAQPPQIDVGNALALAAQLERQKLAGQQAQQSMDLDRQRFGLQQQQFDWQRGQQEAAQQAAQAQRNALAEYTKAQQGGDENALSRLSAYPELQQKVLTVRNSMAEAERGEFDQKLIRNARRAQSVMGLQGEAKQQAWQGALQDALQSGDITPQMYEQYAAQQPNDLMLQNIVEQAVPIQQLYQAPTPQMQELEAAGIEPGTPEFRERIAPAPLPKFEKVNNRLVRIEPDGSAVDVTPATVVEAAKAEKLTEGQSKAANFAHMMRDAELELNENAPKDEQGKVINQGVPKGFWGWVREGIVPEGIANSLRPQEYQQYRQAAGQWIRAKLRKESGAQISDAEFEGEFETFFPQVGDNQAVVDQKARARHEATLGMIAESRGGYDQLFPNDPSPSGKNTSRLPQELVPGSEINEADLNALPEGAIIRDENGNRYQRRGDQLIPVQ